MEAKCMHGIQYRHSHTHNTHHIHYTLYTSYITQTNRQNRNNKNNSLNNNSANVWNYWKIWLESFWWSKYTTEFEKDKYWLLKQVNFASKREWTERRLDDLRSIGHWRILLERNNIFTMVNQSMSPQYKE